MWNTTTQANSGSAALMMTASCVYRFRIGSRSRYTTAPTLAAISTPSSSPCQPRRRASEGSSAPIRWATSVLAALPIASGSMNIIDTRFSAIWWPATGVAPRREMKNAMKVKPLTSIAIDRPIGMPRRSSAPWLARSTACGRRPSSKRA